MDESKTPLERAQEAAQNSAAFNAARDPVKLRKSLLHIRAAITLGLVKKTDLTPLPKPASQQRVAGQRRRPAAGALIEQPVTARFLPGFPPGPMSGGQIGPGGGKITNCGEGAGRAGYGQAGVVTVIEVAIGPGGAPGMFKVEVVASPAGEASATVELDADSLLARRGLLQQAVLASAVAQPPGAAGDRAAGA